MTALIGLPLLVAWFPFFVWVSDGDGRLDLGEAVCVFGLIVVIILLAIWDQLRAVRF